MSVFRAAIVCAVLAALLGAISLAPYAQEQEPTPHERVIVERVKRLEERIAQLERQLDSVSKRPAPAEDLEERIEKVEKAVQAESEGAPTDLRAYWKDGLRFETKDKRFSLRVGGRLQVDWALFDQDDVLMNAVGDEQDGAEIRSARLNVQGDIYDNIGYRLELEFGGDDGKAKFRDAWLAVNDLPGVGGVKVGHFREPFGLERLQSPLTTTFAERALPNLFAPGRNVGMMLSDALLDDRLTWAVGAFKETDDFPGDQDSDSGQGYVATARVTGLPWYEDKGEKLLHLGLAYSHRNPDGAVIRWRARPETHLANRYVDTEVYEGFRFADAQMDDVDLFGAEAALVYGPFSLQGEYILADVDTDMAGDRTFDGYYAQASYLLTGEHRRYKNSDAVFTRVQPKRNLSLKGDRGWGAWELALRYSAVDLDDGLIRGGKEEDYTLGLNWYLNPNTRVTWNYVHALIDHDLYDGALNIFQTRFQVDF